MSETMIDRVATTLHEKMCRQDIDGYLRADIDCHELARASIEVAAKMIEARYGEMHPGAICLREALKGNQ